MVSFKDFKEMLFPQAKSLEGNTTESVPFNYNPKRIVTFHSRMIKFYQLALEDAKAIEETDYINWLEYRLVKEKNMYIKKKKQLQKKSFQNTLEKSKTN